jgi:hypothetical protein
MRLNASRFVLRVSACHQFTDSGASRHGPSVSGMQPDDLSAAGSCATALARCHRTGSLGRVEVTGRNDMPPGLHDPRAEVRRTEAVPAPSAAGGGTRPPGSGTRSAAQWHAINPVTPALIPAMMANVEEVEVVVAHNERATLRVGDVFVKIDADQIRTDVEVEAMAMAPVPTPEILWRKPPEGRNMRRSDQQRRDKTAAGWLPFRPSALDRFSKNGVGRTGFEPVTSSVSGIIGPACYLLDRRSGLDLCICR